MMRLKLHSRLGRIDGELIEEYALVDDTDYDDLARFTWYYKEDNTGTDQEHVSIARNLSSKEREVSGLLQELINRRVMQLPKGAPPVRYFDGNPLNVQKSNLFIEVNGRRLDGNLVRMICDWHNRWMSYQIPESQMSLFPSEWN